VGVWVLEALGARFTQETQQEREQSSGARERVSVSWAVVFGRISGCSRRGRLVRERPGWRLQWCQGKLALGVGRMEHLRDQSDKCRRERGRRENGQTPRCHRVSGYGLWGQGRRNGN
jgi:hypothetical protein